MSTPTRVSPSEAHRLVRAESYEYVDVRSVEEFDEGHPTGAYNVPWLIRESGKLVPNDAFLRVMKARFEPTAKLVLGCQAGGRSWKAATALLDAGFESVVDQRAGYGGVTDEFGRVLERGWRAEGLPVTTDVDPEHTYEELLARADGTR